MKRKLAISFLTIFLLIAIGAAITIVYIRNTTAELSRLVTLHQVENKRRSLVIQIQTVQSDIYESYLNTYQRHDHMFKHIEQLEHAAFACNSCHHSPEVNRDLGKLESLIGGYKAYFNTYASSTGSLEEKMHLARQATTAGNELLMHAEGLSMVASNRLKGLTDNASMKIKMAQKALWGTLVLVLFLFLQVFFRLSRSITRPVNELLNATKLITSGSLGHQIEYQDQTEFGELANNFNVMSSELKSSYTTLEHTNADLKEEITRRVQIEEELKRAKSTAEAASEAKSLFLAKVSHELRTPMNGIIGMTELLTSTNLDKEQNDYIKTIHSSADSLLRVINDILDISKIEADKLELEENIFNLHKLVHNPVSLLLPQVKAKRIDLTVAIDPDIPNKLVGDSDRLGQVLLNLLGNAIKFTDKGAINLSIKNVSQTDVSVLLSFNVADTGIGISEDQRQAIFEPFIQADNSITRRYGGTGLGLVIARRLVRMMGGDIEVQSAPGSGSTFSYTLPFEVLGNTSSSQTTERQIDNDFTIKEHVQGLEILLVEDNSINQKVATRALHKAGHRIATANDGKEAVNAYEAGSFDLILMDLQMPVMDGYESTRAIRDIERRLEREHTPIIAMTAHAMAEVRDSCLEAGMDDYISKPIKISTLLDTIEQRIQFQTKTSCPPRHHA